MEKGSAERGRKEERFEESERCLTRPEKNKSVEIQGGRQRKEKRNTRRRRTEG